MRALTSKNLPQIFFVVSLKLTENSTQKGF